MPDNEIDASKRIDERIEELGDWRGETLGKLRAIIRVADPDVVEEWKWGRGPRRLRRLGTPLASSRSRLVRGSALRGPRGVRARLAVRNPYGDA